MALGGDIGVQEHVARRRAALTNDVELTRRIGRFVVEEGEKFVVPEGQETGDQLDRPAAGAQVTEVALGRHDGDLIGAVAEDSSGYPDCRPEYIAAFERMANLATRAGVEGRQKLTIHTPLIQLTKAQIIARGRELLAAVRAAPEYRAAVAAHAAGDAAALAAALPAIFVGLEAVGGRPDLFYPVAWQRGGKPRPVADIVAEVQRCRDDGLPAEGDDVAPGTDPSKDVAVYGL